MRLLQKAMYFQAPPQCFSRALNTYCLGHLALSGSFIQTWCPSAPPSLLSSFRLLSTSRPAERQPQQDSWNNKITLLKDFIKQHGHARVPQSHPILGNWVNMNRKEYKKLLLGEQPSRMTPTRVQQLTKLNFVWNENDAAWMDYYDEMCLYEKEHGHW